MAVAEGPVAGVEEGVVEVGAVAAGVLLRALTVLLSPLLSTPRTTLLNISSTFICPLFSGISFLPLAVVSLSGPAPASLSGAPGAAPATVPPSLKAW